MGQLTFDLATTCFTDCMKIFYKVRIFGFSKIQDVHHAFCELLDILHVPWRLHPCDGMDFLWVRLDAVPTNKVTEQVS